MKRFSLLLVLVSLRCLAVPTAFGQTVPAKYLDYDALPDQLSEMGASGRLEHWDRSDDLGKITVPTLTIGARYDTMDPKHMEWMSHQVKHGRYLYCPNGSHLCIYDDQKTYFDGLIRFIKEVDSGKF